MTEPEPEPEPESEPEPKSEPGLANFRRSAVCDVVLSIGPAVQANFNGNIVEPLLRLRNERNRRVTFVDAKGGRKAIPYADLVERAGRFAGGLRARGVAPGEPIVVVLTEPEEALVAILGAMAAGCPPAPIYPPANLDATPYFLRHLDYVAERARARRVIASSRLIALLGAVRTPVDRFSTLLEAEPAAPENPRPDDIAFLQFTSGTTSSPKGVIVTHRMLVANLWMIREASRMTESSKVVTWLPVYHDMGLIGTVLNAITLGIDLSVLAPITFLRQPRLWLEEISRVGGTHTAAPNFAYGLCAKRADSEGLDLSTMRTFICGAEPIQPGTLERFNTHFSAAGLDPGAMTPAYGLAEATLAVTFTPYMRGLRCDDSITPRVPSCGKAMAELQVRIDCRGGRGDGSAAPDREVGEVQVRGPSVTPGYVHDAEATAQCKTADGWLHTGDLGYLADGELHLLGRSKDVIIVRGRNYYAHDIEGIASEHPHVRTGNVVAFGIIEGDSEALVVVAESRTPEQADRIEREVRGMLAERLAVVAHEVRIVPPGTLPKTSSGKLKRAETRDRFSQNRLSPRRNTIETWAVVMRSAAGHLGVRSRTPAE